MRLFISTAMAIIAFAYAPAAHAAADETGSPEIIFVTGTGENAGGGAAPEAAGGPSVEAEAAPSFDRGNEYNAERLNKIADTLANPDMQDGIAIMMERFAGAMMSMPIGQFADAVEKARQGTVKGRIGPDSTVADLAGKNAENLPQEIGSYSRDAMGMMSGFARAFAAIAPQIEAIAKDFEKGIENVPRK